MSQPKMYVDSNGTKRWLLNGEYHLEDGPAVEGSDGSKYWYLNSKWHREDGPAIEYPDGHKQWWLNGKQVTWQQVYRQAKNPEIELRILTAALTNA